MIFSLINLVRFSRFVMDKFASTDMLLVLIFRENNSISQTYKPFFFSYFTAVFRISFSVYYSLYVYLQEYRCNCENHHIT